MTKQLSKNFSDDEFACKHCGKVITNAKLIKCLQDLRDAIGQPIIVNSGFRCPEHNRAIGGAKNSYHCFGMAADIRSAGMSPEDLATRAREIEGIRGLGIYATWIHVDVRDSPNRIEWGGHDGHD